MALQDVLDAMKTCLDQLVPVAEKKFGSAAVAEHGAPPRIVLEPTESVFQAAAERYVRGPGKPPVHYVEAQDVLAHCWGEDDRAAEALRNAVIAAGRFALPKGDFRIIAGANERRPDAVQNMGIVRLLKFTVYLPVVEPPAALGGDVLVTAVDAEDVGVEAQP